MADAGEIKAKVTIEYDGSGVEKAKEDLASLADISGGLEQSAGGAGEGLAALDEQLGKNAESARTFSSAIEELPKMVESGTSAVSDMTDAMSEQRGVIEDTVQSLSDMQEPLKSYNESLQAVSDTISSPHLAENMTAFQRALDDPYPFTVISSHLSETGQSFVDFSANIGEENTALLTGMASTGKSAGELLGGMSVNAQSASKAFTEQFNGITEAVGKANAGINSFGGIEGVLSGPLEELQSLKPVGFGEAFGNASEGIMGALNNIAMPLMAVQMISMAVQAAGQQIYDLAAIAEGPAAHSLGTFTGTVDALGQTAQRTGAQFAEGIGQGVLPVLNQLNYQVSQTQNAGGVGGGLGMALSTLFALGEIGTGTNPIGGLQTLANIGAQIIGVQQPFQGPGPEQQAQITYQQQMANMPQVVQGQIYQMKTQSATLLADSITPSYLQAQDDLSASQAIYQRVQASYNASHPVNQYQMLQDAQYQAYAQQQAINYQQQMANPTYTPYDPLGFWSDVFGGGSGPRASAVSSLLGGGGGGPQASALNLGDIGTASQSLLGSVFGPIFGPAMGGIGGLMGGLGGLINGASFSIPLPNFGNLFGSGTSNAGSETLGPQVAAQIGDIQLPHIDLSGMTSQLAGNFGSIQLPHLDLSAMTAGLAGNFSGIQLPHIDLSGMTAGLASAFSNISLPSIPDIGGMLSGQLSSMFSGISLPTLPDIGGMLSGQLSGMFSGISLPTIPDIGNMINGAMSGIFGGISLPSIPDIGSMLNGAMSGIFSGISLPPVPNLGSMISSAMSGMFSGISIPAVPFFASGIENWQEGGLAVVGDAGPELVALPSGSSVYPMSAGSATGGNVSPISLGGNGGSGGASQPMIINLNIDGQTFWSATGMSLAQNVRASNGMRGY